MTNSCDQEGLPEGVERLVDADIIGWQPVVLAKRFKTERYCPRSSAYRRVPEAIAAARAAGYTGSLGVRVIQLYACERKRFEVVVYQPRRRTRLVRTLLRAFPRSFRAAHGREMEQHFVQGLRDHNGDLVWATYEVSLMIWCGIVERIRTLMKGVRNSYSRGRGS